MLVLMRRIGEKLIIADDIELTVIGLKRNYVRFGIKAPRSIPVHREEVYQRINLEGGEGEKKS